MPVTHEDAGTDTRRIIITGRLDMGGTQVVAPLLADLIATPRKRVIVDLAGVPFLASIGIRALIESAKVVIQRGGRMVLVVDPGSTAVFSLQSTGIDELIPMYMSLAEAQQAIAA